jgi:lysophospholipase L1-like esterase
VKAAHTDDPRTVVAALGDSITAGQPGYDPDPGRQNVFGFGDDPHSSYEYWAHKKNPSLVFRNCGHFGLRTDQIADRFDDCVDGAEALIVEGGINDIVQGIPVATAAANLREMVGKGKALEIPVAIASLLPWNIGPAGSAAQIRRLNGLIEAIGRSEDVPVLPFHQTLAAPSKPDQMPPRLTVEGEHPSVAGYRRLGLMVAAEFAP